jgi:hypothetical protein
MPNHTDAIATVAAILGASATLTGFLLVFLSLVIPQLSRARFVWLSPGVFTRLVSFYVLGAFLGSLVEAWICADWLSNATKDPAFDQAYRNCVQGFFYQILGVGGIGVLVFLAFVPSILGTRVTGPESGRA